MEHILNTSKTEQHGRISLLTIAFILIAILASGYYYIDHKADIRAQDIMSKFVEQARADGVELHYQDIDASPLFRRVSISDFEIKGNEQEPDIQLKNIKITGFGFNALEDETSTLPLSMTVDIENGTLHLKPTMVEADTDLQALVETFDEYIQFSTHFSYELDTETGELTLSTTETVVDNFHFSTELSFGNANWLAELDAQSPEQPSTDMMSTTLNTLTIAFENYGIIEKVRSVAIKKTGKSKQQLTQDSINQLKQLKLIAEKNWGNLFIPMIDEVIKFSAEPQRLELSIHPEKPLGATIFMSAFMSGDAGLLELIKQARIEIKAN